MKREIISNVLVSIVLLGSIIVMLGWILDIQSLKSILPNWVTMKFITAFSFFLCSILVLVMNKKKIGEISKVFILLIGSLLFLIMTIFLISLFTGIGTGIESLFIKEAPGAVKTAVPGVPAIPTILCFIFISLEGLIFYSDTKRIVFNKIFGVLVLIIGAIAILGYILNIPLLYYSFAGFTSMAFHTALFFCLLGISLYLIEGTKNETTN